MSEGPGRLLLGPQRPTHNLAEAIVDAGLPEGKMATISAGWQEAENDIDDLREIVGRPLVDLGIYNRADEVFRADEDLARRYRSRQDRLKEQQRLYRLRLKQLAIAARQTIRAEGDPELIAAEQRHAIAQLRALDRHHLHRTESLQKPFGDAFNTGNNELLARHHREIGEIINGCSAVMITGGNIMVLLNRMRLFGVQRLLASKYLVAWSAGAMVLAERIVLFHDRTPQGRRDAEVFGAGFGLIPGCIFLPDAAHRLREGERSRIELMSRRFSPDECITLDNGTALEFAGDTLLKTGTARRLTDDGRIVRLKVA